MAALDFRFENGAVHLPELRLWLDAHHPVGPEEAVFVSHAHSDHTARHARVLLSPPTQRLMRARVSGEREERVLEFGRPYRDDELAIGHSSLVITLLPAGHIFGSAMVLLEAGGGSLLYTGDFKLRPGLSAESCEPRPADVLVMETTFGRPHYILPPAETVRADIVRFCGEALAAGEVPVLLAYSLGKSQELLRGLLGASLPVMLGEPAAKLARIYESFGHTFPTYRELAAGEVAGHVVIAPPGPALARLRQAGVKCRVAAVTGWALDPSCRFRYRADAAFPLSDHADFPDLVEFVRRVAPRKVYTLHGFAADFATHLRGLGFDAQPLGNRDQLELGLAFKLG